MAYSINPYLPCARKQAVLLVVKERLSVSIVARKFGVSRSTIYRWLWRWQEINPYRDTNWHKKIGQLQFYKFSIPTITSRPKTTPRALPQHIIERVITLKNQLKRCAEVIWHKLTVEEGIRISLSSVRRILARNGHYVKKKWEQRVYRRNPKRPLPINPGDLVQTDTVHLVDPRSGKRKYVYTVIDLCTRMAYARVYERIYQIPALETVLIAEKKFGFKLKVVQSDNGHEFGRLFKEQLELNNERVIRHSRVRHPNDNAHIERFNRTLREECIGSYMSINKTVDQIQKKIDVFLDYYNNERVHLGLKCKTPTEYYYEVLQRC